MAMKKKEKTPKAAKRKTCKGFIGYGGYIRELGLIINKRNFYFRAYRADIPAFDKDKLASLLPGLKYRVQVIADAKGKLFLVGVRADTPEEAAGMLEKYNKMDCLEPVDIDGWFEMMAQELTKEEFVGFPGGKFLDRFPKKKTAVERIQPWGVKTGPNEMEIAGDTVRSMVMMSYPSRVFPAIATEILALSDKIRLSVHLTQTDPDICLAGIDLVKDIPAARIQTMRAFLEQAKKKGVRVFSTCAIISVAGLPGEVGRVCEKVKELCGKYLIAVSELDYQQREAYLSTLPLLHNQIQDNLVLVERNVIPLLPWSVLSDRKNLVWYGEDVISGAVCYNRMVSGENGFVAGTNYDWCLKQVRNEADEYTETAEKDISLVAAGEFPMELPGDVEHSAMELNVFRDAKPELIKACVVRWALSSLSTNGRTMKKHVDMVKAAADIPVDGSYMEGFLAGMGENERRALNGRPFPAVLHADVYKSGHWTVYTVGGAELEKTLAYALVLSRLSGIVYSLNTECISFPTEDLFFPAKDAMYTFTAKDIKRMYRSRQFKGLLGEYPFLMAGEHKISEKLLLCDAVYLTKEQRSWISEPAKGAVLMTKEVMFKLRKDDGTYYTEMPDFA